MTGFSMRVVNLNAMPYIHAWSFSSVNSAREPAYLTSVFYKLSPPSLAPYFFLRSLVCSGQTCSRMKKAERRSESPGERYSLFQRVVSGIFDFIQPLFTKLPIGCQIRYCTKIMRPVN